MIILPLLLVSLSSYPVLPDECVTASLAPGGQALMVEASTVVTVETGDTAECEVRLRLVAVGGGGDGDAFTGNAGGSGYVEYKEVLSSFIKHCIMASILSYNSVLGGSCGRQFSLH